MNIADLLKDKTSCVVTLRKGNNTLDITLKKEDLLDDVKISSISKEIYNFMNSEELVEKPQITQSQQPSPTEITFKEDKNTGYAERTKQNASADATIHLAVNFDTPGEKLTKKSVTSQNKKYIPINATSLVLTEERVDKIVDMLNSVNARTLNIAGNGIYDMKQYTQEQVDEFTYQLLKAVTESPKLKNKIESIRSGGQTGFDEAGAKAGQRLGIPTLVLAPKGWKFRDVNGKDISNEQSFKQRFTSQQPPPVEQQGQPQQQPTSNTLEVKEKTSVENSPLDDQKIIDEQNIKVNKVSQTNEKIIFPDGISLNKSELNLNFNLNEQQLEVLNILYNYLNDKKTKEAFLLKGYAGTGKSTMVRIITAYQMLKNEESAIYFITPTHAAKNVLANMSKGKIDVKTLDSFLGDTEIEFAFLDSKPKRVSYDLLIVDEISMINNKRANDLMNQKSGKMVLMGDEAQLNPPKQNSPSDLLLGKFSKSYNYQLTKVERVKSSNLLSLLTNIRNNMNDIKNIFNFENDKSFWTNLSPISTNAAIIGIADNYLKKGSNLMNLIKEKQVIFTAYSNKRVAEINKILKNKLNPTKDEYAINDIIVGYSNTYENDELTFVNGNTYVIENKTPIKIKIYNETFDAFTLDFGSTSKVMLLESDVVKYGEIMRKAFNNAITKLDRDIYNSYRNKIATTKDYEYGKYNQNDYFKLTKTFDYGYAVTIHKTQGLTTKQIIIDDENIRNTVSYVYKDNPELIGVEISRLRYVALSRASENAVFLSNQKFENPLNQC